MKVLMLLIGSITAQAQTTIALTGPATVKPGQSFTVTLKLNGSSATGPAALQWATTPPANWLISTVTTATAAVSASKVIACTSSRDICLIYGMNSNVLGNGDVAQLSLAAPSTLGTASWPLTSMLGVDKNGSAMAIAPGPLFTVLVTRADINSDGAVNTADVTLMINQALAALAGNAGACTDDQTADGKCDIVDVVAILKAMGL